MTADAPASPLLATILALLADGGTADDLDRRLADLGLTPTPGVVAGALDEAAALGLVRVAASGAGVPRFVPTSLGRRVATTGSLGPDDAAGLRELETLRTDLSATIAHELRTPLTAIRTCAGLLLADDSDPTPEQRRTLVETIERNAERMQRVVGDILDLARFRTGHIALQLRRFDTVAMASDAIASVRPLATSRAVVLDLVSADATLPVYADHRRLEQALVNLLSNAVRFSPDGGRITVSIDRDGGSARLAVRDEGPGIPEADQARLFERFFVGRTDRGAARDGVGLGLPTALAIAQAHGGRIEVDSTPGHGSTFRLVVPVDGPDDAGGTD